MRTSSMMGATTSSKIMPWSAAGEKTLSNWYVLLPSALGPMESSTALPLMPLVETTTPLFSRTSRSLRPRQRTTTLMLVSWPASSKSAAFLLSGDERGVPFVLVEATDSARDVRPSSIGVAERPQIRLFVAVRDAGGRIEEVVRFAVAGAPGLGSPDMSK